MRRSTLCSRASSTTASSTRDHGALDRYLAAVAAARPDGWPRDEQIAFWVNAYNARVLEAVFQRLRAEQK